jgi:hypothetical protein
VFTDLSFAATLTKGMLSDVKREYMSLSHGCGMVSTQSVSYLSLKVEGVVDKKVALFRVFSALEKLLVNEF